MSLGFAMVEGVLMHLGVTRVTREELGYLKQY